jgi:NYN domain
MGRSSKSLYVVFARRRFASCRNFFTAINRWNKEKRKRHIAYISALQRTNVTIIEGTFDRPRKYCWDKQGYCKNYSEKKTDVAIAVAIMADGFENIYDKAFLVTADSDHVPLAERFTTSLPHKRLLHIAPPKRFSEARELAASIGNSFHLTADRLRQHQLPDEFRRIDGRLIVVRPAFYKSK